MHPFRTVVSRPDAWAPTLHLINTLPANSTYDGVPSPLLQCPCTPQRVIDVASGTIDGQQPFPEFGHCNAAFASNPSCSLSSYVGGWRCCEQGVFLIDTDACKLPGCAELPTSRETFKATFFYEAVRAEVA